MFEHETYHPSPLQPAPHLIPSHIDAQERPRQPAPQSLLVHDLAQKSVFGGEGGKGQDDEEEERRGECGSVAAGGWRGGLITCNFKGSTTATIITEDNSVQAWSLASLHSVCTKRMIQNVVGTKNIFRSR